MLPDHIRDACLPVLRSHLKQEVSMGSFDPASGGCINNSGRLKTSSGDFFIKWNSNEKYPKMFEKEAKGLRLLSSSNCVRVPAVVGTAEANKDALLLLEFIKSEPRQKDFFSVFGKSLAKLHSQSSDKFGLDQDNYIGSLPQSNKQHDDFISFFIDERLEKQNTIAYNDGKISKNDLKKLQALYGKLNEIFPVEKPSLLHGDLWSGNFIEDEKGAFCMIDPAVHFGHREAELSFTKLFGGFDKEFYDSYHSVFPLEAGFDARTDIYNLYPLMVHLNIFGGGYINDVKGVLKRF